MLPPDYSARCTVCSWRVSTDDVHYRDTLATQHSARYHGHTIRTLDLA